MKKINEILAMLNVHKQLLFDIKNELAYKKENERQSDMIRDLENKNAILKRDNELLAAALTLEGDTKYVIYKGRRYIVKNITLYEIKSKDQPEADYIEMACSAIETEGDLIV